METNKRIKKISKAGEGKILFITPECKELGWDYGDYFSVSIEGDKLVLKKVKI